MEISIRSLRNAADALKRIRNKAGYTQKQLSDASNVPRSRISEIETGDHNPTLQTYLNLLRSMDVELTADFSVSPDPDAENDSTLSIGGMKA